MNITVAVPTRHRKEKLQNFVQSFLDTTKSDKRPQLLVISDAPNDNDHTISYMDGLRRTLGYPSVEYNINQEKSGLAQLWNHCIWRSRTDWTLVCNDDGIFQPGWLEWLESQIETGKYLQINLMHYGGFCINKKLICLNGWFDERFRGGGYEDNDWQLRLAEGELNDHIYDWTHSWTYMHHNKVNDGNNWTDQNNAHWMIEKWGRIRNWREPSFRRASEIDWHPSYTALYCARYKIESRIPLINSWINSNKPVYHRTLEPK